LTAKRERIFLKCQNCGTEFLQKTPWREEKYCSKKCWATRGGDRPRCKTCGVEIPKWRIYCSIECRNKGSIGSKRSEETKRKMSEAKKGFVPKNAWKSGPAHFRWNPNREEVNPRWRAEYQQWRKAVFERDNYTCVLCGATKEDGVILDADHIVQFSKCKDSRFEIDNGRVLCRSCHMKQPTWGNKSK